MFLKPSVSMIDEPVVLAMFAVPQVPVPWMLQLAMKRLFSISA